MCKECIDCERRVELCHSGCDEYKAFKKGKVDSFDSGDYQYRQYMNDTFAKNFKRKLRYLG